MSHNKSTLTNHLELLKTINDIHFTQREIDILSCLIHARSAKKIATIFSITPKTIENHTHNIMAKLGCNSREGVLDFVERSGKIQLLRQHYTTLLIYEIFEKSLKQISQLNKSHKCNSLFISGKEESLKDDLLNNLQADLQKAGFSLNVQQKKQKQAENFSIYLMGNPSPSVERLDLENESNYYYAFFTILQTRIPTQPIANIFQDFKQNYERITKELDPVQIILNSEVNNRTQMKVWNIGRFTKLFSHKFAVFFILFVFCSFAIFFFLPNQYLPHHNQEKLLARSDFIIPNDSVLLNRSNILAEIDHKLNTQKGIQTIAIIGPGGSGKTILARHYAHQQNAQVVWELNAETIESLKNSMEELATTLAKNNEDIQKISTIKNLKNQNERDFKILEFVKENLRNNQPWILVYDNIENFVDVQKYFPHDVVTWGKGKVIITTRNENIQNNKFVNSSLTVGELSDKQKFSLFSKIISIGDQTNQTSRNVEETEKFLESIPSLPLDVTLAASYLKSTNEPYGKYLEQLSLNKTDFENIQHDILKEAGDYSRTRYQIISKSIQSLIKANPEFEDLLFLMSVIDSQNISRELLNVYKNDVSIVNFIHNLKKYSLITNELDLAHVGLVLSLHRSTQENALNYFKNNLNKEDYKNKLNKVFFALETLSDGITSTDNFPKMNHIIPHMRTFLNQSDLLSPVSKGVISCYLGYCFGFIGNYSQSMRFLNDGLNDLKNSKDNELRVARASNQLGIMQTELGNFKSAKELLELSLSIYKRYPHDKHYIRWAVNFNLADVYREVGEYKKAETYFKESLNAYKHIPEKKPAHMSWILYFLGKLYEDSCILHKAKQNYEECLLLYKNDLPKNHIIYPLVLCRLGNVYRKLGDIKTAKSFVEQGNTLCKSLFPKNHWVYADVLVCLGLMHRDLGDIIKARSLIEESLNIYRGLYNPNHPKIALTFREVAKLDWLEGKRAEAESFLNESLRLCEINKTPQIYIVLEDLAELMNSHQREALKKGDIKNAELFKRKGEEYLMRANDIKTRIFLKSE